MKCIIIILFFINCSNNNIFIRFIWVFINAPVVFRPLYYAVYLEGFVNLVEFFGYLYLGEALLNNFSSRTVMIRRYYDWFITTCAMLISLVYC